jgi:putative transposase
MIDVFEASRSRLGFALCGYVLMPDHWHALIAMSSPLTVSRVLHAIKTTATRKIHKTRGAKGLLWQHQFRDRFVRNTQEFHERLEYMHMNPVRKGLVAQPEEWRWSSHSNFSSDRSVVQQCPIQIDFMQLSGDYRG